MAHPTNALLLYQVRNEIAAASPAARSHITGIPACKVPPKREIAPTAGTIIAKSTMPDTNSRRLTDISGSSSSPLKLENIPSSPQQIAAISAQIIPSVKFALPSGFTQFITIAPDTQIIMPATTLFVGFCFKNIQEKMAPNKLHVAEIGIA